MRIFDAAATREALPYPALIEALRAMFIAGCEVPPRQVHTIGDALTSLVMPAWQVAGCYGVKVVNIAADNAARGLPGVQACYLLFDATTGVPLASIDGNVLTARRTAAASALAASMLARADARRLLLVGAGAVARELPAAHRTVRAIEEVVVWARDAAKADALAAALCGEGFAARAGSDLAAEAAQADIVSCATLAAAPLIRGRWLRAGVHLDLVGSFRSDLREADDDCFAGAAVTIDTEEALRKSGDLLGPIASGAWHADHLRGTLATLCRDPAAGRRSESERTVFKSVGTALEDLAAAMLAAGVAMPTQTQACSKP